MLACSVSGREWRGTGSCSTVVFPPWFMKPVVWWVYLIVCIFVVWWMAPIVWKNPILKPSSFVLVVYENSNTISISIPVAGIDNWNRSIRSMVWNMKPSGWPTEFCCHLNKSCIQRPDCFPNNNQKLPAIDALCNDLNWYEITLGWYQIYSCPTLKNILCAFFSSFRERCRYLNSGRSSHFSSARCFRKNSNSGGCVQHERERHASLTPHVIIWVPDSQWGSCRRNGKPRARTEHILFLFKFRWQGQGKRNKKTRPHRELNSDLENQNLEW